jgi:single-strand DNA-binding protein
MTGALVTIDGNLTADPELRFTQNGISVVSFTVAHTPRKLDRATNEWKDGDTVFLRCSVWRDQGENIAASLKKGNAVIVIGRLVQRKYQTREGENREVTECEADIVSIDLRRQRVQQVARVRRDDAAPAADEPWTPAGPVALPSAASSAA